MRPPKKRSAAPPLQGPSRVFVIMVILGILLVFGSLVLTVSTKKMLEASRLVIGTIVRVSPAGTTGGSQSYYPVISAEDEDGRTFEVTGSVSYHPAPTIGETVKLAYPPRRPQEAFIVGLLGIWFLPVFVGGGGAALTLVGLILLFATSQPNTSKPQPASAGKKRKRSKH